MIQNKHKGKPPDNPITVPDKIPRHHLKPDHAKHQDILHEHQAKLVSKINAGEATPEDHYQFSKVRERLNQITQAALAQIAATEQQGKPKFRREVKNAEGYQIPSRIHYQVDRPFIDEGAARAMGLTHHHHVLHILGAPEHLPIDEHKLNYYPRNNRVISSVYAPYYDFTRAIVPSEKIVYNEGFQVSNLGNGLGSRIFHGQATRMSKLGYRMIRTRALRDQSHNGHYTWPRLGYDAKFTSHERGQLPEQYQHAQTVQHLFSIPGGMKWWEHNGWSKNMDFDLHPNSNSMKILHDYMRERAARPGVKEHKAEEIPPTTNTKKSMIEDIQLEPWEEEALDRVWAKRLGQTINEQSVPTEKGTIPIPKGHVRIYHYTKGNPQQIREQGLLIKHAKGSTYGEPNLIWGSTIPPDPQHNIVEFHVPVTDLTRDAEKPPSPDIDLREWEKGHHHVTIRRDVRPHEIIAVHEPWHSRYRYIKANPKVLKDTLAGEHDSLLDIEDYGKAIKQIKKEHGITNNEENDPQHQVLRSYIHPDSAKTLKRRGIVSQQHLLHVVGAPTHLEINDHRTVPMKVTGGQPLVRTTIQSPHYWMDRIINTHDNTVHNQEIQLTHTGTGLGSQIFHNQVKHLAGLGFRKITAFGAREDSRGRQTFNGYYTLPAAFNYNGLLNGREKNKLPKEYRSANDIQELMRMPGGRKWWKANGWARPYEFDLRHGSPDRQGLEEYMAEKNRELEEAARNPKGTHNAANRQPGDGFEEIDLSPEEEAALERVWAKRIKEANQLEEEQDSLFPPPDLPIGDTTTTNAKKKSSPSKSKDTPTIDLDYHGNPVERPKIVSWIVGDVSNPGEKEYVRYYNPTGHVMHFTKDPKEVFETSDFDDAKHIARIAREVYKRHSFGVGSSHVYGAGRYAPKEPPTTNAPTQIESVDHQGGRWITSSNGPGHLVHILDEEPEDMDSPKRRGKAPTSPISPPEAASVDFLTPEQIKHQHILHEHQYRLLEKINDGDGHHEDHRQFSEIRDRLNELHQLAMRRREDKELFDEFSTKKGEIEDRHYQKALKAGEVDPLEVDHKRLEERHKKRKSKLDAKRARELEDDIG